MCIKSGQKSKGTILYDSYFDDIIFMRRFGESVDTIAHILHDVLIDKYLSRVEEEEQDLCSKLLEETIKSPLEKFPEIYGRYVLWVEKYSSYIGFDKVKEHFPSLVPRYVPFRDNTSSLSQYRKSIVSTAAMLQAHSDNLAMSIETIKNGKIGGKYQDFNKENLFIEFADGFCKDREVIGNVVSAIEYYDEKILAHLEKVVKEYEGYDEIVFDD